MSVLAVIPAKAHSFRVPGKNLRPLGGRPLVAWTIEAALKSELLDRVLVSTEDERIAAVARDLGAEVLMRPPGLAADGVEAPAVVLHAVASVDPRPDVVVMLLPTSPFRTAGQIDQAIHVHLETGGGVVSATQRWAFSEKPPGVERDLAPNGAIWVAQRTRLEADGYFRCDCILHMDEETGLDIDWPHDFAAAEWIAAQIAGIVSPEELLDALIRQGAE